MLRVLDAKGKLVYRVQLPPEGNPSPDPNPSPTPQPKPCHSPGKATNPNPTPTLPLPLSTQDPIPALLGKTILVGWEPSGAVLAVVQKLGGAFLWSAPFPPLPIPNPNQAPLQARGYTAVGGHLPRSRCDLATSLCDLPRSRCDLATSRLPRFPSKPESVQQWEGMQADQG